MNKRTTFAVVTLLLASGCAVFTSSHYSLPDVLSPSGLIYYVRPDGGNAQQCNGLADIPYPGNGQNLACAWDHPNRALPPGGPPRISGGDTLIIAGGSYRIGIGSPGADSPALCNSDNPWDCTLSPIPAGPDPQHPTLILGEGWNTGCNAPPELWGTERVTHLFNLTHTSNAAIACLELTDHATCADGHPDGALICQRGSYPYGDWASVGIYAEDADNILLRNLNIHGMAVAGIHAGRLSNWRIEHTRLAGNGLAGWDGDLWQGSDSNDGTLEFSNLVVEWNGCVEGYPDRQPHGCWAQPAGGYGDGLGTGVTGGTWIFEDSTFLHNTSDGLDLLYASNKARIVIRRSRAEGNAGNQIKTSGVAEIENTIISGNCAFFDGQPFTTGGDYNGDGKVESGVENCRAKGNALSIDLWRGNRVSVINSSLTGQGDCLVIAQCAQAGGCEGNEEVILQNDLFIGQIDFTNPPEPSCLSYYEGLPEDPFTINYSFIYGVKDYVCPGSHSICGIDPLIVSMNPASFNPQPLENSPLLGTARQLKCPETDFNGRRRPQGNACDIGAVELLSDSLFFFPFIGK
jgi:hypothetical protein